MKLSESVKPVSYFKAHASEVIRDVVANRKTVVITQNGEARVVLQGVEEYEQLLESLALLRMLAQSKKSLDEGRVKSAEKAFRDLRTKIKESRES